MILNILFWAVAVLFGLKVLWNILTPYVLAWELFKSVSGKTRRVTMMPFVEISLLILAVALAVVAPLPFTAKEVALWGGVLVVLSYIHFVVVGVSAGWIVSLLRKE